MFECFACRAAYDDAIGRHFCRDRCNARVMPPFFYLLGLMSRSFVQYYGRKQNAESALCDDDYEAKICKDLLDHFLFEEASICPSCRNVCPMIKHIAMRSINPPQQKAKECAKNILPNAYLAVDAIKKYFDSLQVFTEQMKSECQTKECYDFVLTVYIFCTIVARKESSVFDFDYLSFDKNFCRALQNRRLGFQMCVSCDISIGVCKETE